MARCTRTWLLALALLAAAMQLVLARPGGHCKPGYGSDDGRGRCWRCRVPGCRRCDTAPTACQACQPGRFLLAHGPGGPRCWQAAVPRHEYVLVGGFSGGGESEILALDTRDGSLAPLAASAAAGPRANYFAYVPAAGGGPHVRYVVAANRLARRVTSLTLARWQLAPGGARGPWGVRVANLTALPPGDGTSVPVPEPGHVAVSPSGRWALATHLKGGVLSVVPLRRRAAGGAPALGPEASVQANAVGIGAHQALFAPGGRHLYTPLRDSNAVRHWAFDDATGRLAELATDPLPVPGGPRHMAFHPRLPVAYVVTEFDCQVARLDWSPASGRLNADFEAEPQRLVPAAPPDAPNGTYTGAELAVSLDGRFLYASVRGETGPPSYITVFSVDPESGALTPLQYTTGGGELAVPRHFSLSSGDRWLLAGNMESDSVTVFARNATTGRLRKVQTLATPRVRRPSYVAVIPPPPGGGS